VPNFPSFHKEIVTLCQRAFTPQALTLLKKKKKKKKKKTGAADEEIAREKRRMLGVIGYTLEFI
jgi:hypothetical protein